MSISEYLNLAVTTLSAILGKSIFKRYADYILVNIFYESGCVLFQGGAA